MKTTKPDALDRAREKERRHSRRKQRFWQIVRVLLNRSVS